jgi:N-acetylglucosaminyldiphosphoundecaprenol N-acetyl-beta-D-mannosaminyltransferase
MLSVKEKLLGYELATETPESFFDGLFAELTEGRADQGHCRWLACFNPHSYAVAKHDPAFADALKQCDWLVADGSGVLLASRIMGGDIRTRITGSDVFYTLNARMNAAGGRRVFFLGSTEETLSQIRVKIAADYPYIHVAGTCSPPFTSEFSKEEVDAMISAVNDARADVLWVGMTAPKQEKWIHDNLNRLDVRFAGAIGAVFDFYTGRVKRSHPVFQKLGLEWLPRLLQQPKRLWRRTFVSAPVFLFDVIRARFFGQY